MSSKWKMAFLLFVCNMAWGGDHALSKSGLVENVFEWATAYMHLKVDKKIELPIVRNVENVSKEEFERECPDCRNKRINLYSPSRNEIWLLPNAQEHVLAHEIVHFIQVKYKRMSWESSAEDLEHDADRVQCAYEKKMMKGDCDLSAF